MPQDVNPVMAAEALLIEHALVQRGARRMLNQVILRMTRALQEGWTIEQFAESLVTQQRELLDTAEQAQG